MKRRLILFFAFFILFLFAFRSLASNLSSALPDWLDYPYIVWTIFQNIEKIKTFNFAHFFDTNAFYPNKLTLLFSDTLLPQSIVALLFSFLTINPILVFNLTFIVTFILNYVAVFLFWNQIFKKDWLAFLGTLFVIFSPFFHHQLGHFQMQSYWPLFFALYFLFKNEEKKTVRNLVLVGIFLSIQFLSSVYLAVFLLFSILAFYGVRVLFSREWEMVAKSFFLIIGVFILVDSVFIKGYLDTKKIYGIKRDYGEYVTYSAHLSDYLFTTNINSALHKLPLITRWNSFDKHVVGEKASFPGFLLSILALFGMFSFTKRKERFWINLQLDKRQLFFLIILFFGILFSLGPRLNFNGAYVYIPTPYTLFLKFIPFLDSIRVPARWSFLFYLGIIYFSLNLIKKLLTLNNYFRILALTIFALFVLEYLPLAAEAQVKEYKGKPYQLLETICSKEKKVLLEVPVTHFRVEGGIVVGLDYISKVLLSSLYHKCYLVNGYSGYQPPSILALEESIENLLKEGKGNDLVQLFLNNKIELVKFNSKQMLPETRIGFQDLLPSLVNSRKVEVLSDDVLRIKY